MDRDRDTRDNRDPRDQRDMREGPVRGGPGGPRDGRRFIPHAHARSDGEVTKMGGGESYRPAAHALPHPPREPRFGRDRDRSPPPFRRGNRSPMRRDRSPFQGDTFRPRIRDRSPYRPSRSPPPRRMSPMGRRSPFRGGRRFSPPRRDRSPPLRRSPIRSARSPARVPPLSRSPSPMRKSRSPVKELIQRSPVRQRSPGAVSSRSRSRSRSPVRRSPPPVRRFSPRRSPVRRGLDGVDERSDISRGPDPRGPPPPRNRSRSPFRNSRPPIRQRSPYRNDSPPRGPREGRGGFRGGRGGGRFRSRSPYRGRPDRDFDDRMPYRDRFNGPNNNWRRGRSRSPSSNDRTMSSGQTSEGPSRRPSPRGYRGPMREDTRSPFVRPGSPGRDSRMSTPRVRSPIRDRDISPMTRHTDENAPPASSIRRRSPLPPQRAPPPEKPFRAPTGPREGARFGAGRFDDYNSSANARPVNPNSVPLKSPRSVTGNPNDVPIRSPNPALVRRESSASSVHASAATATTGGQLNAEAKSFKPAAAEDVVMKDATPIKTETPAPAVSATPSKEATPALKSSVSAPPTIPTAPAAQAKSEEKPAQVPTAPSVPTAPAAASLPTGPRNMPAGPRGGGYAGRGGRPSFNAPRPMPPSNDAWGAAPATPSAPRASAPAASTRPSASPVMTPGAIPTGPRASVGTQQTVAHNTWHIEAPQPQSTQATPSRASHASSHISTEDWGRGTSTSTPARTPSISAPTGPSSHAFHSHAHHTPHRAFVRPAIHPSLANLTPIIPGGKIDPTYSGVPAVVPHLLGERLRRDEDDCERIRWEMIKSQEKLRKGLKEWKALELESRVAGWRSEPPAGEDGDEVLGFGNGKTGGGEEDVLMGGAF